MVNGMESWRDKSDHAIWYSEKLKDWNIGIQSAIGTTFCLIHTKSNSKSIEDKKNEWKYWNGGNWITANGDDIRVHAIKDQGSI